MMNEYPKRLIEVDLPIARISAHARREKSIRHGHISTLHIWWARRPLAACRAVMCAALWPDPEDLTRFAAVEEATAGSGEGESGRRSDGPAVRPARFLDEARQRMAEWATRHYAKASPESHSRLMAVGKNPTLLDDPVELRRALLDFIADFANWDNSTDPAYLETARALTQAAHEALGGEPGTRPLVVDPFAGGGSIPLEALRVGADAFASDLNPIPVLLNKVVLEYIPKYGNAECRMLNAEGREQTFHGLADAVRYWGGWIKEQAERELAEFYPRDPDGSTPIAYLWARTIDCEGPGCGVRVPLLRSLWLRKKGQPRVALQLRVSADRTVATGVIRDPRASAVPEGTVRRGSATCPACGYTTPAAQVRAQFTGRKGGADDAQLVAVVLQATEATGPQFRDPRPADVEAFLSAQKRLCSLAAHRDGLSLLPEEKLPYLRSIFNINLLGVNKWMHLFNARQALALITLGKHLRRISPSCVEGSDLETHRAVATHLAFVIDRCADYWSSLSVWAGDFVAHTFGRQALGIVWDYAEANGMAGASGSYDGAVDWVCRCIQQQAPARLPSGHSALASACEHPLPSDVASLFFTDPPYYDAVPYADLSDFFYVWLKRSLGRWFPDLLKSELTPKSDEVVQLAERNKDYAFKTKEYFEERMCTAMSEGRRIAPPHGLGIVVFAHKSTTGWETQLSAMIKAGWIVVASWPIDTERPGRLRANNSAALASSVHLVCRPREDSSGEVREDDVGDWRDVLGELPRRMHEWMPRLAAEGVVGADAIFACLGPALEIFSRHSRVEKASGDVVTLGEYLEQVWAAVSKEALSLLFRDADAAGLEPDARLTAMWLWTLGGGNGGNGSGNGKGNGKGTKARRHEGTKGEDDDDGAESGPSDAEDEGESEGGGKKAKAAGGFVLEFDAARKIAQGLGAHLEKLPTVVEVKGDKARLLSVGERTKHLFGKDAAAAEPRGRRRRKPAQGSLFEELERAEAAEAGGWDVAGPSAGATVLDRVHQAMILFAAGRGEAMRRFLVDDGAGKDARFWKLADNLVKLYPSGTDERRWLEGVLGRKKGLGL